MIDKIYVDFNDRVVRNQLMAVIDTTILSVQVSDAKASLLRSQAQYDEAKYNYERTEKLYQQSLLSELEYITARSNFQSAKSSLMSSQNNLEKAERNMLYAFIRSPINGTVIYREVEEGQTVASSFQTPRLFLIAEDLSKMEIHALVDESEIGLIKVGQAVQFEVQAYDEKKFSGTVRQVWLQPETVQNVVNYTVVVDADNPDGLLLPGMTATLDFIIELKKDVLLAPIAATRVQPTASMMKKIFENMQAQFGADGATRPEGIPTAGFAGTGSGAGMSFNGATPMNGSNFAMLWYFDAEKELQAAPVRTGSSDGRNIEIIPLPGADIKAGVQVISKVESTESSDATTTNMPRPPGFGRPF
ncbi:efflux RND transporter periplasmic adaptor subunit [candidate division KSB1 bacterium]|nr:efflux RND transporter periplasmic adaptor subunit [candidate division KSB1 bacterium]RQW06164.1 MAG: efflux RND transporter periplasmic adaptor subunit [candidate division KSB1 bacterium]